jgi:hypothetical protein
MAIIFFGYKKSFVMRRGYQITGVSRRNFLRISRLQLTLYALLLIRPQDVDYSFPREAIQIDTRKGNTSDTADNDAPKCPDEKIFHPGIIRNIRRDGMDGQQIVILLEIFMVARRI